MKSSLEIKFFVFSFCALVAYAQEFDARGCNTVNRACTLVQFKKEPIYANGSDFWKYRSKLAIIEGTYTLVNSSMEKLPPTHGLIRIASSPSLLLTGNPNLKYVNEMDGLAAVDGPVTIRNNPKLQIPVYLYKILCAHKQSICDVDVVCESSVHITNGQSNTFHPSCTVINGDLVIVGMKEQTAEKINMKVHTVNGAVRLIYNKVESFDFLKSLTNINYKYKSGCALEVFANKGIHKLGLKNLKEIKTNHKAAKFLCLKKNSYAESNMYYTIDTNVEDKQIFDTFLKSGLYEQDDVPIFVPADDGTPLTLFSVGCALLGLLILFCMYWVLDYMFGILLYKKLDAGTDRQRLLSETSLH